MRQHVARRIGMIGDIHAEHERLAIAITSVIAAGADRIVCTGDVVDGRGSADECVSILAGRDVVCVRGNHERWFLDGQTICTTVTDASRRWLAALPKTSVIDTSLGRLVVCHGVGLDDMALVVADARVVVAGHTHMRDVRAVTALGRQMRWINPGALTDDRDPGWAMLDCDARTVTFWDIDGDVVATIRL